MKSRMVLTIFKHSVVGICCVAALIGNSCTKKPKRVPVIEDRADWISIPANTQIGSFMKYKDQIYYNSNPFCTTRFAIKDLIKLDADPITFKVSFDGEYGRDKDNVYHDPTGRDIDYSLRSELGRYYVLDNVSPDKFKYLGFGYGIHESILYKKDMQVSWDSILVVRLQNLPDRIIKRQRERAIKIIPIE